MTFQVIASMGHCATTWLAGVLDLVPGQNWTHEARRTVTGMSWQEAYDYPPDSPALDSYWHSIRARMMEHDIVGDSNSWPPELLPAVNAVMPIDRVIYMTRDPEAQLHSIVTTSPVWSKTPLHPIAARRLDLFAELTGELPTVELMVAMNEFFPDWLRGHGLTVDVYSMETLTTNTAALRRLAPLPPKVLRQLQSVRVNQKVFNDG